MSLQLPTMPLTNQNAQSTWKRILEAADAQNWKAGQDIIPGRNRIILTDSNGGTWAITVSTSGILSAVAVTLPPRGTSG